MTTKEKELRDLVRASYAILASKNIKRLLEEKDMSRGQLIKMARIDPVTLCSYINQKSLPGTLAICKMATALGCTPNDILLEPKEIHTSNTDSDKRKWIIGDLMNTSKCIEVISKNLRRLLKGKNMTITWLSGEIGTSLNNVSSYINQKSLPGTLAICKMATALGCTPNDILLEPKEIHTTNVMQDEVTSNVMQDEVIPIVAQDETLSNVMQDEVIPIDVQDEVTPIDSDKRKVVISITNSIEESNVQIEVTPIDSDKRKVVISINI